jgi:capsular polysaccharide biosynthesis protein
MEDYSFFDQVGLMQQAQIVVGISGAGHTNIHFMKKGSKFLDITAKKNIERKKYKFHFWKLACIIGVDYFYQYAEISNKRLDIPYYNRNIIVNLNELEQNIIKMIYE